MWGEGEEWGGKYSREGGRLKKKMCKDGVKQKNSCKVNYLVGLANCTRLNGTLAATSELQF